MSVGCTGTGTADNLMDSIVEALQSSDIKEKVSALERLLPELRRHVELRSLEVNPPKELFTINRICMRYRLVY